MVRQIDGDTEYRKCGEVEIKQMIAPNTARHAGGNKIRENFFNILRFLHNILSCLIDIST